MVTHSPRHDILEKAEPVEEAMWHRHIAAFIDSFIIQHKRVRWHHLCIEKPQKAWRDSSKMVIDLDYNICSKLDYESEQKIKRRHDKGMFYDFSGKAWWLSAEDAIFVGHGYDALFSIEAGALAICFWHELEDYLCCK